MAPLVLTIDFGKVCIYNELYKFSDKEKKMKKGKLITIFVSIIVILLIFIGILIKVLYDVNYTKEDLYETKQRVEEKLSKKDKKKDKKEENRIIFEAVLKPGDYDGIPSDKELDAAKTAIETRLDNIGITDRKVKADEKDASIRVRFDLGVRTEEDAKQVIGEILKLGNFTFRDAEGNILLDSSDVKNSEAEYNEGIGQYVVVLNFSKEGAEKFETATANLVGQQMPIFMDEIMVSCPIVNERISGGKAIITGMETEEQAEYLAALINSGALPFSLVLESHTIIEPS